MPLSYSQQRMWFLWQMEPDSPAYNVGGMARLNGVLDVARFEAALQALIMRHETLRTTFPSVDGVARQQVTRNPAAHGVAGFHRAGCRRPRVAVQQLADDEAHQPFDLETGPLLRAAWSRPPSRNTTWC